MKRYIWSIPLFLTLLAGFSCEWILVKLDSKVDVLGVEEDEQDKTKLIVRNNSDYNFATIWICREADDVIYIDDSTTATITTDILVNNIYAINRFQENSVDIDNFPNNDTAGVYLWIEYTNRTVEPPNKVSTTTNSLLSLFTTVTKQSIMTWEPCPWVLPRQTTSTDTSNTDTSTDTTTTTSTTTTTDTTTTTTTSTDTSTTIYNTLEHGLIFFPTNATQLPPTTTSSTYLQPYFILKYGYKNRIEISTFSIITSNQY